MSRKQGKSKSLRRVEIEWWDSAGLDSKWESRRSTRVKPMACVSVGYIVRKTKRYLEVAPHLTKYQKAGHFAIPRAAIRRMRKV
jgi:hypothetical protein